MSENVNEETPVWVEETQMTLGSIVHRPKLTTKLLMKPPFRFIHDVILETVRVTGFQGLSIQSDEFDSSNFTERHSKVLFLERIIDGVSKALGGRVVDANPSKIVAGSEPEKTNKLLVALFEAATAKPKPAALLAPAVVERSSSPATIIQVDTQSSPHIQLEDFLRKLTRATGQLPRSTLSEVLSAAQGIDKETEDIRSECNSLIQQLGGIVG